LASTYLPAQSLPACPEIGQSPGLKVVLDNVRLNAPQGANASPQDELFMTRLRYMLETRFRDPRFKASMTRCNRYPASRSLFDQGTLENLNDNNVVLELWGDVLPSGPGLQQAFITYLLVPVRFSEFGSSERGVYTIPHNVPSSPDGDALLHLFGQGDELPAYALVSLGVKQLRNHEFDAAKKNLVVGQFQLSRIFGRTPDADQKALLSYVHERTCDTVRQARADATYVAKKGGLTYLSDAEVAKICAP
jgi:hypothetical protein